MLKYSFRIVKLNRRGLYIKQNAVKYKTICKEGGKGWKTSVFQMLSKLGLLYLRLKIRLKIKDQFFLDDMCPVLSFKWIGDGVGFSSFYSVHPGGNPIFCSIQFPTYFHIY